MPQDLTLIWASPGDMADIHCPVVNETFLLMVSWYKEDEGKNLRRIYESFPYAKQVQGRYSSQGQGLRISDVQRNDSGVYYCATTRLMRGTRLVISDADPKGDFNAWNTSGETSQDQNYITMANGNGDFSIWSVKLITPTQVPDTCSEKRNVGSPAENCISILYFGVPCVVAIILLIPLSALFFRKLLHTGIAEKPGNQIPMREIPQTEYAELRCSK
ncbi:immunoglobulin gamma-1 heavy chain-like [Podarcis lilfordi]|nr:immunoglobulin gamma-1 heavy chain-like [Podarcis lilfordi]